MPISNNVNKLWNNDKPTQACGLPPYASGHPQKTETLVIWIEIELWSIYIYNVVLPSYPVQHVRIYPPLWNCDSELITLSTKLRHFFWLSDSQTMLSTFLQHPLPLIHLLRQCIVALALIVLDDGLTIVTNVSTTKPTVVTRHTNSQLTLESVVPVTHVHLSCHVWHVSGWKS